MFREAMGGEKSSPSSMMLKIKEIDIEKIRDMGFRFCGSNIYQVFTIEKD